MPHTSEQILQQEFLLARAKILELAATLDRIERAGGDVSALPQRKLLEQGFNLLISPLADTGQAGTGQAGPSRAEQVQLLFSREYSDQWRQTFGV
ncbi:MAG: hypothetical protein IT423_10635 [Pirellulaceae bacterium]|nr:hypothetical protein [Pirellulaceae bacterium]